MLLPDILGTIPSWISAGGISAGLGMLLNNQIASRKLSIEDREALRTGYAATEARNTITIDALTKDCVDLREELRRTRREADDDREDCHKVTGALRTIVIALREELAGLRMNGLASDAAAIRLAANKGLDDLSPVMQRALRTIDEVTGTRHQSEAEQQRDKDHHGD